MYAELNITSRDCLGQQRLIKPQKSSVQGPPNSPKRTNEWEDNCIYYTHCFPKVPPTPWTPLKNLKSKTEATQLLHLLVTRRCNLCCLRNTNKIKIHKTVLKRDTENESEKMSCREKDKKKKCTCSQISKCLLLRHLEPF